MYQSNDVRGIVAGSRGIDAIAGQQRCRLTQQSERIVLALHLDWIGRCFISLCHPRFAHYARLCAVEVPYTATNPEVGKALLEHGEKPILPELGILRKAV